MILTNTLLSCLCALTPLVHAQSEDPSGEIRIRQGPVSFTHLSPLVTYAEPSLWNFTRDAAISPAIRPTDPDADPDEWDDRKRFSYEYISKQLVVYGEAREVAYEVEPPVRSEDGVYGYLGVYPVDERVAGSPPWTPYPIFRLDDNREIYQWRNVSVIPRPDQDAALNYAQWWAPMPMRDPLPWNISDRTTITIQEAVNLDSNSTDPDSNRNITFGPPNTRQRDDSLAWNITSIPDLDEVDVNGTSIDPFSPNNTIADIVSPPGTYRNTIRNNVNTSHVLSSNVANAAAYFLAPRGTSLVRIYGSVGPDMGLYNVVRWTDEPYHWLNRSSISPTYDAYRPIYATGQLLYVALVDPDVEWSFGINKVSPGGSETDDPDKRIEVNSAVYMTYLENPINDLTSSYLDKVNEATRARVAEEEKGDGLSGGQIAGIVVGSVAGAALIGGLIFWLVRRRKRSHQANDTRRGSESTWVDNEAARKASPTV